MAWLRHRSWAYSEERKFAVLWTRMSWENFAVRSGQRSRAPTVPLARIARYSQEARDRGQTRSSSDTLYFWRGKERGAAPGLPDLRSRSGWEDRWQECS